MAPNLIGKDPIHTEALWRQNKDQAWWYGYGGGIAAYAVAAIDIALWDLKGKALGASVLDLLGGPVHDRLPAIASCHAHFDSIPEMVEEAAEWLSTGLQGVKTGFGKRGNARLGYEHDRDVEYVTRDARRHRARQDADDRQRHRDQVGRDRRRAPHAGDGGVRPDLGRGAARRLGSGGLRQPAGEDDDPHRLRRARMDARAASSACSRPAPST